MFKSHCGTYDSELHVTNSQCAQISPSAQKENNESKKINKNEKKVTKKHILLQHDSKAHIRPSQKRDRKTNKKNKNLFENTTKTRKCVHPSTRLAVAPLRRPPPLAPRPVGHIIGTSIYRTPCGGTPRRSSTSTTDNHDSTAVLRVSHISMCWHLDRPRRSTAGWPYHSDVDLSHTVRWKPALIVL